MKYDFDPSQPSLYFVFTLYEVKYVAESRRNECRTRCKHMKQPPKDPCRRSAFLAQGKLSTCFHFPFGVNAAQEVETMEYGIRTMVYENR
jgi:hypothetical protein